MQRMQYSRLSQALALFSCALISALLFASTHGQVFSLLPLLGFVVWRFLPLAGAAADQKFLLAFVALAFFIDDLSQVAWGRNVDPITEQLGLLLYQSFGITGMEAFAVAFTAWLIIARTQEQRVRWISKGLLGLIFLSSSIFLSSVVSGWLSPELNIKTYFIQTRFLHLLPLWTFIGFVVLRSTEMMDRLLNLVTVVVAAKCFQAMFIYISNKATLDREEYLVDHYFSAYCVIAGLGLLRFLLLSSQWTKRTLCFASLLALAATYFLNDRRTSYIAVGLALFVLPFCLPWLVIKRYLVRASVLAALLGTFVAVTWDLPKPLGFVGQTVKSIGKETGTEGPSYRDLETANILYAVAQEPVRGIGLGREFDEIYPMPDISFVYDRYRMIPHNLFLAAWAYGGPLSMTATSLIFVLMIAASVRLINYGGSHVFIGVVALSFFLQYFSYTFGDLGLQITRNQMMAGLLWGGCFRLWKEYHHGVR